MAAETQEQPQRSTRILGSLPRITLESWGSDINIDGWLALFFQHLLPSTSTHHRAGPPPHHTELAIDVWVLSLVEVEHVYSRHFPGSAAGSGGAVQAGVRVELHQRGVRVLGHHAEWAVARTEICVVIAGEENPVPAELIKINLERPHAALGHVGLVFFPAHPVCGALGTPAPGTVMDINFQIGALENIYLTQYLTWFRNCWINTFF